MLSQYLTPLLLTLPLASAGILARDFTGTGHIRVLKSDNWKTASPSQTVGCIDDKGKFVVDNDKECGLFKLDTNFPYTLSSRVGNCTFEDQSQERNTDSQFGWMDYAYSCDADHAASVYDQMYSMDGFPEILLCFGEFACYFDAKRAPKKNDELPLWQFRWGYGQEGITPGHVQLQLMWDRVSDEKREVSEEPSHRINLDNAQIPLKGRRKKY